MMRIRGPEKNNLTVKIERGRVRGNVKVFDKQKCDPNAAKTGTGNTRKHEPVNFWIDEVKK